MFQAIYPIFERGRVLKIEMLEALRDFPRDLLKVYLKDYKDGVLTGCEISTQNQLLVINPGIIHIQGVLYILKEAYSLPYLSNNRLTLLKVNCMGNDQEKDFIRYISQIYLDYQTTCKETEIELCRFKLKEGANLRANYQDFYDFNTEYDTVNRISVPYVNGLQTTLVPEIIKAYGEAVLTYSDVTPVDLQFALMALQHEGDLKRSVIENYLKLKNEWLQENSHNEDIYLALTRTLQTIAEGRNKKSVHQGFGEGIWID